MSNTAWYEFLRELVNSYISSRTRCCLILIPNSIHLILITILISILILILIPIQNFYSDSHFDSPVILIAILQF